MKNETKTKAKTKAKAKPAPAKKEAAAVEKKGSSLVKVTNVTKYMHVQRSTGIKINAGETKELKKDSWLEAEIKAGLFKLA